MSTNVYLRPQADVAAEILVHKRRSSLLKPHICIALLLFMPWSLLCACALARDEGDPTRTVTLTVTVADPNDAPIPEFSAGVRAASADVRSTVDALSDPSGQAVAQLHVPVNTQELHVRLGPRIEASMSSDAVLSGNNSFRELKRQFSIRSQYSVPISANQSDFSLEIQLAPAVSVRGRLVTPTGEPVIRGMISARGCACYASTERDGSGVFVLDGVQKSEAVEVVLSGNSETTRLIVLSPTQTQNDLDLGDVVLQPKGGISRVRLPSPAPPSGQGSLQVTVISADGNYIVSVIARTDGELADASLNQGWLPPGQYYVLSGSLHVDQTGWLLLDLIRAGRADDHPELTSFVASPTEEVSVLIDPKETAQRIKAAAIAEAISPNP